MEIVFLGTGCPVVSTERYGPAQLILADGAKILVDCGSGVTQRLLAAGTPGRDLDALLLTHLHSDHLVDLYQLIVSAWHPSSEEHTSPLQSLMRPSYAVSSLQHPPPPTPPPPP